MEGTSGNHGRSDGSLTIDLEDWRHALNPRPGSDYRKRTPPDAEYLASATRAILVELDRVGAKATFFVLGEVALAAPDVVREIARRGHEVASHSPVHLPPRMIPRGDYISMIRRDISLLEDLAGRRPIGFRTPYMAIRRSDGWLLRTLEELGFLYDSSVAPTWTPYWGMPSAPKSPYFPSSSDIARPQKEGRLLEIPLTVWPTVRGMPGLPIAGGFYMRAWPTGALSWMLRRNVSRGHPLVLYAHLGNLEGEKESIRDPTVRDRISQYAMAGRGKASFRSIIERFRFDTIESVFASHLSRIAPTGEPGKA